MISRVERTRFAEWWWTVDRMMLAAIAVLMMTGIVLSLAASPAVATRIGLDAFYFVNRHAMYLAPTFLVMIAVSFLSPRQIRRLTLAVFIIALAMTAATLVIGAEVKGARRWIVLAGVNIQPSEFVKPAFVILISWLFAESTRKSDMPANTIALGLLGAVVVPLVLQPDFGQTMLIVAGVGRAVLHGRHAHDLGRGARRGRRGRACGRLFLRAARHQTHRSLHGPVVRRHYQVSNAMESFVRGGWFGRGPGEGTVKRILPDSHADFVFAVAAEEFGIVLCLALVALFAFIVIRALQHAFRDQDPFTRFAAAGLAILFGTQSAINMAVNLHLIPAKGMTLPFISYGGSSMISLAYGMGMLLALTRERPRAAMIEPMERLPPEWKTA